METSPSLQTRHTCWTLEWEPPSGREEPQSHLQTGGTVAAAPRPKQGHVLCQSGSGLQPASKEHTPLWSDAHSELISKETWGMWVPRGPTQPSHKSTLTVHDSEVQACSLGQAVLPCPVTFRLLSVGRGHLPRICGSLTDGLPLGSTWVTFPDPSLPLCAQFTLCQQSPPGSSPRLLNTLSQHTHRHIHTCPKYF